MSQQAGWYDDPQDEANLRYWDGVQWTNHTSPKQKPGLDRVGRSSPAQGGEGHGQDQRQAGWQDQGSGQGSGWPGADPAQRDPYAPQDGPPFQGQWQQQQPMPGYGHQPSPRDVTPDGQPVAGWGTRLLARLIDSFLLGMVVAALSSVLTGVPDFWARYVEAVADPQSILSLPVELADGLLRLSIASAVIGLVYETVTTALLGGTLGKLVLGLRVRHRDQPGNLGWGYAVLRAAIWNLAPLASTVGTLFTLVNGLWPLWDDKKQALHDKAVRSNVVKRQRQPR